MASASAGEEIALYFDIHTNGVPSSEIRGQITAVPVPAASLLLLGGVAVLGRLRRHSV